MGLTFFKNTVLLVVLTIISCGSSVEKKEQSEEKKESQETGLKTQDAQIIVGAEQFQLYSELLKSKNVGVVANQTSFLENENQHLVDFLISKKVSVKKVLRQSTVFEALPMPAST